MTSSLPSLRSALRTDLTSSLVVFLVALPLCVAVAVASGIPAELGLIAGIVGGLVTGLLPGSSLQVSGPAAGLTVFVLTAVQKYGLPAPGLIVLATGLITGLRHHDHACMSALQNWADRHNAHTVQPERTRASA